MTARQVFEAAGVAVSFARVDLFEERRAWIGGRPQGSSRIGVYSLRRSYWFIP